MERKTLITTDQKAKGIAFIILAAFGFSMMSTFVKLAGDSIPPFQKAFFRNAFAFIFIGCIMLKNKVSFKPRKDCVKDLIFRSLFGSIGIVCNFYAVDRLLLSDANMLNKLSPFFAIVFSIFLLREKPTLVQIAGVLTALAGSALVIKPSLQNPQLFASLIGLAGGMCAGCAYTFVRKLGQQGENSSLIIFFFSAFSCLMCVPFIVFDHSPMTIIQVVYMILAGVFACVGQYGITKAYFYAPAKDISVYDYSQILFAAAIGFLVFDQVPDLLSVVGYVLICGAGIGMFYYKKKQKSII